ncbi:DUF397 domain-containing protein [Streptomyces sp. Rer75]|uniref:DUF397 domain-containing protein n=1 Tax=Streptomyces sp. Rer75 TaxID=2750011 RepID=UPI0015CF95ED|nr:DUF397 domain-containing protein [Streptomyces sp. Rer75]QLH20465.1 DUF397 domain-containing protein [Streptomyces sp. Rer75]
MIRHGLPESRWHKSSCSSGEGPTCVETQSTDDGLMAVGDSKDRSRGAITSTTVAWATFIDAVKYEGFAAL